MSNYNVEIGEREWCVWSGAWMIYLILHGGIALNNLRGKWKMVQSFYNKLTRPSIYPWVFLCNWRIIYIKYYILFYMHGSSLLIRNKCLLLLLLLLYYYYLVLFYSMVSGRGLSPCHRCHPIFKSVPREREMGKLLKIGWQRWHGDNPPPWKVLLKMKPKKVNNLKAISSHIIEPKVR